MPRFLGVKQFLLLTFLFTAQLGFAQTGKISGKVLDGNNMPVAGATVKIVNGKAGTATDIEGRFTLTVQPGRYSLTITALGFKTKTIEDVAVTRGGVEEVQFSLENASKVLDGVTVKASSAKKETTASIIQFQKNTNTVASVISAEAIRRSPDKNTGEVLKRVPGASIVDGKFLVVRGLSDRYNAALLNGVPLTSTEPDRKTFAFDMIPSGMIDNIIINKAFVPEMTGDWAGGLVQVNTRDIPSKGFLNVQVGTGFNTQAVANDFWGYQGGKYDAFGLDDGTRALPASFINKSTFDNSNQATKNAVGFDMQNVWSPQRLGTPINHSFQISGGFASTLFGKKVGGSLGISYSRSNRYLQLTNRQFNFGGGGTASIDFDYNDDKYNTDVLWGALGNFTMQLNNNNKISYKTIFNVNTNNYVNRRSGVENFGTTPLDSVRGNELAFQQNIFWTNQIIGEHFLPTQKLRVKWYGSFSILDGYQPDQRRILYRKSNAVPSQPYEMLISDVLSQRSGNRFTQMLNEYIYTAGGDVSRNFTWKGRTQTVKAGYLFQVRDRLFDATPFSIGLIGNNPSLIRMTPEMAFSAANFSATAEPGKLYFDAIRGNRFRYMANSILNAAYIQFDNQLSDKLRLVWGARLEDFDQLVGSQKTSDSRHSYSRVRDILPGLNATYKLTQKTNIRFSASQTVVRPEFRELATFEFYDFELNAAVQGSPTLKRTKVTNLDLRYELYPNAGETINFGVFYKNFQNPIEQVFVVAGGGASTFFYTNPQAANAFGAELEVRKKLEGIGLKNFTFQSNISVIQSKIQDDALAAAGLLRNRPMQGQSPYVVNAGLLYDVEKLGLNMTVLFNQVGQRIYLVGNDQVPDIWEASRPLLDFQVAKKVIQNKGEIRLNVQDIFNQRLFFYQNLDGNNTRNKSVDVDRFSRRFGTTFNLTFSYNIR